MRCYLKARLNRFVYGLYLKSINISISSRFKRYTIDSLSYISLLTVLNSAIFVLLTSYISQVYIKFQVCDNSEVLNQKDKL